MRRDALPSKAHLSGKRRGGHIDTARIVALLLFWLASPVASFELPTVSELREYLRWGAPVQPPARADPSVTEPTSGRGDSGESESWGFRWYAEGSQSKLGGIFGMWWQSWRETVWFSNGEATGWIRSDGGWILYFIDVGGTCLFGRA